MHFRPLPLFAMALLIATGASAQTTPPPPPPPPKLILAIAVDQFSADLFAEYRNRYAFGFKRLQQGAVFPSGYQSHAATETCPGHSTIMTGAHPARTGIIANNWFDLGVARAKKLIIAPRTRPRRRRTSAITSPPQSTCWSPRSETA